MQKLISNIRNKPEHIRRKIALVVTIACGVLLILFWATTLKGQFSSKNEEYGGIKKDFAPFFMIKDGVNTAFDDIKGGVNKIGE